MAVTPFDYGEMREAADELIEEFGRQVSFVKLGSTPADAQRPWRGEDITSDNRLDGKWAAIVPYDSKDDKDSVRFGIMICIVSGSQFPSNDGETYNALIDADGSLWHLHDAQIVNPGAMKVCYIFRAEQ